MSTPLHPTRVQYSNQAHEVRKAAIETQQIVDANKRDFETAKAFAEEVERRYFASDCRDDWRVIMQQVLADWGNRT